MLYRSIFDVVRDFLHDEALEGRRQGCLTKYLKPDLLIVDDMGMKNLPRTERRSSCSRSSCGATKPARTMMTSNRPLEDWGKLIGDVPSATAILDRFLHHAEVIAITGRSYRLRNQAGEDARLNPRTTTSKPAIPPTGSSGKNRAKPPRNEAERLLSSRQPLANRNAFNEDQDIITPAAQFCPPVAAFELPDDSDSTASGRLDL